MQEIIEYLRGENYDTAIVLLRQALLESPSPQKKFFLGQALMGKQCWNEAIVAFQSCLTEPEPIASKAQCNIALCEVNKGNLQIAAEGLSQIYHPRASDEIIINYAGVLYKMGQAKEAYLVLDKAVDRLKHTIAYHTLGSAALDIGYAERAQQAFEASVACGDNIDSYIWLAALEVDRGAFDVAINRLEKALEIDVKVPYAHFLLAALYDEIQQPHSSMEHFRALSFVEHRPWIESWNYISSIRSPQSKHLGSTQKGFRTIPPLIDGLCLELGVRFGNSLRLLHEHCGRAWHGFDTFAGLPEVWHGVASGSYSTYGRRPVLDGDISLYEGLFCDTLPNFMAKHHGPVALLHIDCDLYSSTRDGLMLLGPWIVPGTILIFDELIMNAHWQEDEFKAFEEARKHFGWKVSLHAFSLFSDQVIFVVEDTV